MPGRLGTRAAGAGRGCACAHCLPGRAAARKADVGHETKPVRGARARSEARAALLQENGGALSLDEAAAHWGVQVRDSRGSAAAGLGLFAVFHEPAAIEIDVQNAADTDDALQKAGVYEALGAVPTRDILLAHELYHFLEFRDGAALQPKSMSHCGGWAALPIKAACPACRR